MVHLRPSATVDDLRAKVGSPTVARFQFRRATVGGPPGDRTRDTLIKRHDTAENG